MSAREFNGWAAFYAVEQEDAGAEAGTHGLIADAIRKARGG